MFILHSIICLLRYDWRDTLGTGILSADIFAYRAALKGRVMFLYCSVYIYT